MLSSDCFTLFSSDVQSHSRPTQFTYPFYYQPHPLCIKAAEELQHHLMTQTQWQHNFGVEDDANTFAAHDKARGKMFGVMVVENTKGQLGYLCAFSGKIADQNLIPGFVPPVFDMLTDDGFVRPELTAITELNNHYKAQAANPRITELSLLIEAEQAQYHQEEQIQRELMIAGRANRKQQRKLAQASQNESELQATLDRLSKESVAEKNQLKHLKQKWDVQINQHQAELDDLNAKLNVLIEKRRKMSTALQHKVFAQYRFLNAKGEPRDLNAIFKDNDTPVPPAGAGECAAPKLLHYAYLNQLTPIAIAEFWWGTSPKSEVRKHKQFYPACHSKCHPILGHMLKGLDVEPNPLETGWAEDKTLDIVYQDDAIVVVNKPSGLLSVPGKTIKDSAYTRLVEQFPDVEGPFVIHRLDMATSGLLVFALTRRANKSLQKQFISREVKKRYVALLEGIVEQNEGKIELPLRGDPDDRPRQLVCYEHGKPALTTWQVIQRQSTRTKLYLHPHTGRTHQLRVHCAHHEGLDIAMVGDGLYGEKADRLHLHAESLSFSHPYSKEALHFQVDADF